MKDNNQLTELITGLKVLAIEQKADLWKRLATDLEKPTRQRCVVNLSRINVHSAPEETVVVPGKVLSSGDLDHAVTIAALSFSETAEKKINEKGKAITISELMKKSPDGKKIRIIG
ncbi:MAG: 50S ribosomal protein L18e [archaeon]